MLLAIIGVLMASAQEQPKVIHLWDKGAPGFESRRNEPEQAKDWWVKNIHNPSITVFLPPKAIATGVGIVVVPGGGHSQLVFGPEGVEPAKYLNSLGIAAFVLKHRLAREPGSPYKIEIHAKEDGYRAMRLVRSRASEFGIDPARLGILGFSAGGEVVSLVAYGSGDGDPSAPDPIDRVNGKPNFQMLIYPGPIGVPDVVPSDAPPAFMLVSNDDGGHSDVIIDLLQKYRKAKVPVEAHILAEGGHGYNMGNRSQSVTVKNWPQRMADWLTDSGFLKPKK